MSLTIVDALVLCAKKNVSVLDAEILLAHALHVSRTYLHTWPEKNLTSSQQELFLEYVKRCEQGEPVAYITGHREFWSLDLLVTPDVLIPRPETELIVDLTLQQVSSENAVIADLGTGSGAIALALAREKPQWIIHAVDASLSALNIAKINAERLSIKNIIFHHGNWFESLPPILFDAVVSNPPYIAEDDIHIKSGDLRFEPALALISPAGGLQDIMQIISGAKNYLKTQGLLFLEHGYDQAKNVSSIFEKEGYTCTVTHQDLSGLDRVTFASWMRF